MSGNTVSYKLGKDAKAYVGAAGSTPATEAKHIQDLTLTLTRDLIEATTRLLAAAGFKGYLPGLADVEISFDMLCNAGDTTRATLKSAFQSGTAVGVKVLDSASGDGIDMDAYVSDFTENQELNGVIKNNVKLKPCVVDDSRLPTYVSSGSNG